MADQAVIDRETTVFAEHRTSEAPDPFLFSVSESLHRLWHVNQSSRLTLQVSYAQKNSERHVKSVFCLTADSICVALSE